MYNTARSPKIWHFFAILGRKWQKFQRRGRGGYLTKIEVMLDPAGGGGFPTPNPTPTAPMTRRAADWLTCSLVPGCYYMCTCNSNMYTTHMYVCMYVCMSYVCACRCGYSYLILSVVLSAVCMLSVRTFYSWAFAFGCWVLHTFWSLNSTYLASVRQKFSPAAQF